MKSALDSRRNPARSGRQAGRVRKSSPGLLQQYNFSRPAGRGGKEASPVQSPQIRVVRVAGRGGKEVSPVQPLQSRVVKPAGRAGGKKASSGQQQSSQVTVAGRAGKDIISAHPQQDKFVKVAGSSGSITARISDMYSTAARFPAASQAAMASGAVGIVGSNIYCAVSKMYLRSARACHLGVFLHVQQRQSG